uniref:Reverse transcriptase zinc-binding domain-containing protein n=1 Tax=Oryza brachyantha TaxID=4533 RepID=J3MED5_ORYBR
MDGRNAAIAGPRLDGVVVGRRHRLDSISVYLFRSPEEQFVLPLSAQAFDEYQQLQQDIQSLHLTVGNDNWSHIWKLDKYSSQKFYKLNFLSITPPTLKWIWDSQLNMKIKVFGWLFFIDILNTKDLLDRKKMIPPAGYNYEPLRK